MSRASDLLLAAFGATVTDEGYENGLLVCRLAEAADRYAQVLEKIETSSKANPIGMACVHEAERAEDDMRAASAARRSAGLIKG